MFNKFSKKCNIPRYARGADGEINLASFCSSGVLCVAPGRLEFVHQEGNLRPMGSVEVPQSLTDCIMCPPH